MMAQENPQEVSVQPDLYKVANRGLGISAVSKDQYSLGKWVSDQGNDLWALVSAIPQTLISAGKGLVDAPADIKKIIDDYQDLQRFKDLDGSVDPWDATTEAIKNTSSDIWRGITEHYRDHDGNITAKSAALAPVKRPLMVGLDLLTLLSAGSAAGIRMSPTLGRLGELAGAGKAGELAEMYAAKFKKYGDMPYEYAASGLRKLENTKLVNKIEKTFGFDPDTRARAKLGASAYMRTKRDGLEFQRAVESKKVRPEMAVAIRDIIRGNFKGTLKATLAKMTPDERGFLVNLAKSERFMSEEMIDTGFMFESGKYSKRLKAAAKVRHLAGERRKELLDTLIDETGAPIPDEDIASILKYKYGEDATLGDLSKSELASAKAAFKESKSEFDLTKSLPENADLKDVDFDDLFLSHQRDTDPKSLSMGEAIERELLGRTLHDFVKPGLKQKASSAGFGGRYYPGKGEMDDIQKAFKKSFFTRLEALAKQRQWQAMIGDSARPWSGKADDLLPGYSELPKYYKSLIDNQQIITGAAVHRAVSMKADDLMKAGVPVEKIGLRIAEDILPDVERAVDATVKEMFDPKGQMQVPKEIARAMEIDLAPTGGPLKVYDTLLNKWRYIVLNWSIRYYANNLIGNAVLTALAGEDPLRPSPFALKYKPAEATFAQTASDFPDFMAQFSLTKGKQRLDKLFDKATYYTDRMPRELLLDRFMQRALKERELLDHMVKRFGIHDEASMMQLAYMARDTVLKLKTELASGSGVKLQARTGGVRTFKGRKAKMAALRRAVVDSARREQLMRKLKPIADRVEKAIGDMERFLGAYGRLTAFERNYVRRVIPFWTFQKTMYQLLYFMPLIRPKTTWLWNVMGQMAMDSFNDMRLPDRYKDAAFIGVDENGMLQFLRSGGMNPFEMISKRRYNNIPGLTSFGGLPIPGLLDPLQNPLFSLAHKAVGGYDQWSRVEKPGKREMVDSMGRFWNIDEQGNIRQVSPQKPLVEGLYELVPQLSLINDMMAEAGFPVFNQGPKIVRLPSGRTITPRYLRDSMVKFITGMSIDEVDERSIRIQEVRRRISLIRDIMRRAMMEPDPEQREQIRKVAAHVIANINKSRLR